MDINTSLSGIRNAFVRQDVSANNVANINTKNYQAKTAADKNKAETKGNNVSLANEMVNQINNVNQEKANVNVVKAQNQMLGSLIDLKA